MATGKTIASTRWTFVDKGMSLLFNILSKLVRTFLPRSKHLLLSWLQSPSAVILEPPKIKSATVSTVSPSICHEVIGCHDLSFGTLPPAPWKVLLEMVVSMLLLTLPMSLSIGMMDFGTHTRGDERFKILWHGKREKIFYAFGCPWMKMLLRNRTRKTMRS